MKPHKHEDPKTRRWTRGTKITCIIFTALALLFYVAGNFGMGNFTVTLLLIFLLNKFVLLGWIKKFQEKVWPAVQNKYVTLLKHVLHHPRKLLVATFLLLIFSFLMVGWRGVKVVFFPQADPNFVYVYLSLPIGTNPAHTNTVLKEVEKRVHKVIGDNKDVQSVISNVTINVTDPQDEDQGKYSNKGKIQIAFVPFSERTGPPTSVYLDKIRKAVRGIPGAEISVNQEQAGPPVSKPISIEVAGDNLEQLVYTSNKLKRYLDSVRVGGVEELRSDFLNNKPEIVIDINRERANREGISIGQIGSEIRKAVFGLDKASKFRDANDEYPIQIRYREDQRNNIEAIRNLRITYRDMGMGGLIRSVPISAFADIRYENTYGGIKRKSQKRVITLSSNVLDKFNPNEVVAQVEKSMKEFKSADGIDIRMGGQQEEQKETGAFLGTALLVSLGLIFIILVTQFNSLSKPLIIISEILFSVIGVLLGVAIFKMDMSIVMTGIGIVALAGIVVRNGILLVEFTDLMKEQGMNTYDAIVEAGRTRMTPVILTATATILGLIPLAVGMNIDFITMFTELNPKIFFGGDSVAFWGPLSWTMIFGLGFATLLTLFLVPAMYLLTDMLKARLSRRKELKKELVPVN